MPSFLAILYVLIFLVLVAYLLSTSVKIISEGDRALVENLGKYKRTLKPGLNLLIPFVEKIIYIDTVRERVLDVKPQPTISSDNVALLIDAVVFWQILELKRAYYAVDRIELAISSLVLTTLRSKVGTMDLKSILSAEQELNQDLLRDLDNATSQWGIKIIRIEIQDITPPARVQESMALQQAAENEKQAELKKAQAEVESIEMLAKALNLNPNDPRFLNFLLARQNIDTNQKKIS